MRIILTGLLILAACHVHAAKTVYVTDKLEVMLRSGQGTQHKILSSLESGTPLTILKNDSGAGWTYVRTGDNKTGWVLTRYLSDIPIARAQLATAITELENLRQESKQVKEERNALKADHQNKSTETDALNREKDQLIQEVASIRQASSNAVQILEERNQLQERVVVLENELQKVKRENKAFDDRIAQDWFLIGAGVLLGGIILGLILPKLSWRRKSRSWDSF